MDAKLAMDGGNPIRTGGWAKWPQYTDETLEMLRQVLSSGRWAISGPYVGTELFEKRFASAFAEFCGAKYCVPCDHGSSALLIALEALGIGFGDEVIIPALTWVATATAVVNVNAIPVLVDIDPVTLCIDPIKVEKAITPLTKAIMPVHLYSGMCAMDRLVEISNRYGIPIIEDCAHVHGAKWGDKYAGTLGKVGAFSLQQSKLLTAGEGGVVITDDAEIYDRLQLLRADSRRYDNGSLNHHEMELKPVKKIQGTNFCMSEFQAAILLQQLKELSQQNLHRQRLVSYLQEQLVGVDEIEFQKVESALQLRTFYCLPFRINTKSSPYLDIVRLRESLAAILPLPVERIYPPINRTLTYFPRSKKDFRSAKNIWTERVIRQRNSPRQNLRFKLISLCHIGCSWEMKRIWMILPSESRNPFSCKKLVVKSC